MTDLTRTPEVNLISQIRKTCHVGSYSLFEKRHSHDGDVETILVQVVFYLSRLFRTFPSNLSWQFSRHGSRSTTKRRLEAYLSPPDMILQYSLCIPVPLSQYKLYPSRQITVITRCSWLKQETLFEHFYFVYLNNKSAIHNFFYRGNISYARV